MSIMKNERSRLDEQVLAEVFATAILSASSDGRILFEDCTVKPMAKIQFNNERELHHYLAWRHDVDTWDILDLTRNEKYFKRRNIFGEIDTISSEYVLRCEIARDAGGVWEQKDISVSPVHRDKYIIMQSGWFSKKMFLTTESIDEVAEYCDLRNSSRLNLNKIIGLILAAMTVGGLVLSSRKKITLTDISLDATKSESGPVVEVGSSEGGLSSPVAYLACNLVANMPSLLGQGKVKPNLFASTVCFFAVNAPTVYANECDQNIKQCFKSINAGEVARNAFWAGTAGAAGGAAGGPWVAAAGAAIGASIGAIGTIHNQIADTTDCIDMNQAKEATCIEGHCKYESQ